ncbi:MAG: hypothetical protein ACJASF_001551 [Vicingaceae bacterium]|jgi:hypothetical protein
MRVTRKLTLIALYIGLFSACINDDEGTVTPDPVPIDRGNVEVNRMKITLSAKTGNASTQTIEFYDPDGLGGNAPIKNEMLTLEYPISSSFKPYSGSIKFFKDSMDVTSLIKDAASRYVVCYREMDTDNLRISERNNDSDGVTFGIEALWSVIDERARGNTGNGQVKITLNYNQLQKIGLCDTGVRIFEGTINYQHQ